MRVKVYGDRGSGNCRKVAYVCDYLGIDYDWIDVDIMKGESRTPTFLALNPEGQVPLVEVAPGRLLRQSNAILLFLARDTALVPSDPWQAAQVHQWLFWEQYTHEPSVAVCRFQMLYLGKPASALDPARVAKGNAALDLMEQQLRTRDWLACDSPTVADIALLAYTRVAHEGGFDLSERRAVRHWVGRCERLLGIADA
jgi:glutathione S-transferase